MDMIYLDHNATTPAAPSVLAAMHQVLTSEWANPSSIHRLGQQARRRVDQAREQVAGFIGAQPQEIIFSGGGTESVNTAIRSALRSQPDRRLVITSQVEHSAVRELLEDLQGEGIETLMIAHDSSGIVDCDSLQEMLRARSHEVALVSVMWANNETGVIEPVERIASLCKEYGVMFHSDATQWVGKMPADVSTIPFDMISFAAHKFHGPKGVGVLFARTGVSCHPLVIGGGQERSRRGGTENVPGIVGLGEACRLSADWFDGGGLVHMAPMRDAFEQSIVDRIPEACVIGRDAPRMWSTSSIGFPELEPELVLLMLSERGVCASSGSACSSGALKPSKVIEAIGRQPCQVADVPYGAVRFSLSRETSPTQLKAGAEIVIDVVQELQQGIPTMNAGATGN